MEPWEREVLEIRQIPPLSEEHRRQFHAAEDAVNARLAKPLEAAHLHHDREIAKTATSTRNGISNAYDGRPTQPNLN